MGSGGFQREILHSYVGVRRVDSGQKTEASAIKLRCHISCRDHITGQRPDKCSWQNSPLLCSASSSYCFLSCLLLEQATGCRTSHQPWTPEVRHLSLCILASSLPRRFGDLNPLSRTFVVFWLPCTLKATHSLLGRVHRAAPENTVVMFPSSRPKTE